MVRVLLYSTVQYAVLSGQSIPLTWNKIVYDTNNTFTLNDSKIFVPNKAVFAKIAFNLDIQLIVAGNCQFYGRKNGSDYAGQPSHEITTGTNNLSFEFNATSMLTPIKNEDYFEIYAENNSSGILIITTGQWVWFGAEFHYTYTGSTPT